MLGLAERFRKPSITQHTVDINIIIFLCYTLPKQQLPRMDRCTATSNSGKQHPAIQTSYFAQKPAQINELYISNWHVLQQTSHISLNKKTQKNDQPIKHETVMDKFMAPRISLRSLGVRSDVCFLRCEGDVWALKLACLPRCATWVELGGHAVYGVECNPFFRAPICFVRKRSKSFCRRAWDWVVVAGKVCLSWELQNMNSLFSCFLWFSLLGFEYASIANFTLCLAGMIFMRPMLVILAPCYRQNTWHGSLLSTQHITTLWWGLSATTILWPTSDYYSLGLRAMCRMLRKLSLLVSFRSSFFALVS